MEDNLKNVLEPGAVLVSDKTQYRVVKVLGRGGFGITYLVYGQLKVENVTAEAMFAIKEHFPEVFCTRERGQVCPRTDKLDEYNRSKADFIAEARKLHALGSKCENIVKVNEVFEANGTAYYVMQYINGQSLTSYISKQGKLPYSQAMEILLPIFNAVDFLHSSRINHLDIKPDNIMLHEDSNGLTPILIDFGLSVHFKKNGEKTSPKGVHGCTDGYAPLEQYAGISEFIPAADIYSLMATLLHMLTGLTPKAAAELRPGDIRSMLTKVGAPGEIIDGVCKAMNMSYYDRTQSIALLKADLGVAQGVGGLRTKVLSTNEPKHERKNQLKVIGAVAALVIVGAVLYGVFGGKDSDPIEEDPVDIEEFIDEPETVVEEETPAIEPTADQSTPQPSTPSTPQPSTPSTTSTTSTPSTPSTPQPSQPKQTSGTLSLGYATWQGGIKNGKPDGRGTLTFTSTHSVDRNSSTTANPGDYFKALYDEGSLISGKLYNSNGELLETIIP